MLVDIYGHGRNDEIKYYYCQYTKEIIWVNKHAIKSYNDVLEQYQINLKIKTKVD